MIARRQRCKRCRTGSLPMAKPEGAAMQDYLILKLEGVLQSWGIHTYEDYRPSNMFPTLSGILGLLAACLGIERKDWERLQALDRSIELAVRVDRAMLGTRRLTPVKITDFHTVMDARK